MKSCVYLDNTILSIQLTLHVFVSVSVPCACLWSIPFSLTTFFTLSYLKLACLYGSKNKQKKKTKNLSSTSDANDFKSNALFQCSDCACTHIYKHTCMNASSRNMFMLNQALIWSICCESIGCDHNRFQCRTKKRKLRKLFVWSPKFWTTTIPGKNHSLWCRSS